MSSCVDVHAICNMGPVPLTFADNRRGAQCRQAQASCLKCSRCMSRVRSVACEPIRSHSQGADDEDVNQLPIRRTFGGECVGCCRQTYSAGQHHLGRQHLEQQRAEQHRFAGGEFSPSNELRPSRMLGYRRYSIHERCGQHHVREQRQDVPISSAGGTAQLQLSRFQPIGMGSSRPGPCAA